jgi:hypothetical protein
VSAEDLGRLLRVCEQRYDGVVWNFQGGISDFTVLVGA